MWNSWFLPPRRRWTHASFLCQLIDAKRLWQINFLYNYRNWMCKYFGFFQCVLLLWLFSLHPHYGKRNAGTLHLHILFISWPALNCIQIWKWAAVLVLITRILPSKESQTKQKTNAKVKLLTHLGKTVRLFLAVWETRNSIREETAEWCRGRTVLMTCRMHTGMAVPAFNHPLLWLSSSLILWLQNKCPNMGINKGCLANIQQPT